MTFAPADLAEIVRRYGLRHWVEQGYKQLKQELGWADFMVRADQAIRRHWSLVFCACSFCWRAWFTTGPPPAPSDPPATADSGAIPAPERGENGPRTADPDAPGLLATDAPSDTRLARPLDLPLALLARLVERAPAARATRAPRRRRPGTPARPLSPQLTNYRYSGLQGLLPNPTATNFLRH